MAANLALKELRERQGLTQSGLARRLGISRGTVSQWESGASKISSARLEQLSDIFNVDISRLTQSTASAPASAGVGECPDAAAPVPVPPACEGAAAVLEKFCSLAAQMRSLRNQFDLSELEQAVQEAQSLIDAFEIPILSLTTEQFTAGASSLSEEALLARYSRLLKKRVSSPREDQGAPLLAQRNPWRKRGPRPAQSVFIVSKCRPKVNVFSFCVRFSIPSHKRRRCTYPHGPQSRSLRAAPPQRRLAGPPPCRRQGHPAGGVLPGSPGDRSADGCKRAVISPGPVSSGRGTFRLSRRALPKHGGAS